ncbi:MAG TPA: transcription termination/antitermination NusG family protein [Thermoleophilia bacterium]|nr:transcription termination/antitermination NusG family protein [Thermoleophilia bacterium]
MEASWYALRTKPNRERQAWEQTRARRVNTFYPRVRVRPVNPRARKVRAYFPGYIFVQADLEQTGLSLFKYMPYATGLVCFGGEPARVPDALIHALQRRMQELAERGELRGGPKKNDRVWIAEGPLAGYEAIFDTRLSGGRRVRLLLQMLSGRIVPVELDAGQIECKQEVWA